MKDLHDEHAVLSTGHRGPVTDQQLDQGVRDWVVVQPGGGDEYKNERLTMRLMLWREDDSKMTVRSRGSCMVHEDCTVATRSLNPSATDSENTSFVLF